MNIRIQAIHFDATDQLEAFIQKKVAKLEQYFDGIISAEVSLKVVKPESAKNKVDSGKLTVDSLCHFPVLSVNYQFSTVNLLGSYQSGQMGLTVTQLSFDFGGSNPSLPTTISKAIKIAEVAQLIEH